ncbi:MAG TPA: BON domain-containing protein [Burkholderiales bacterium]|jgi:osmotically-inducible protein OsmY|nr:BON domain-containing protein [Burkholderiales bacterium]
MRRYRYAALLPLIPALALQGCPAVIGVGSVAAVSSLEDRRTTGTQLDDSGIESRAAARIGERIGERGRITVTAYNRAILLTGEVWDQATRAEAEKLAAEVPNVRSVTNEIQVAGIASATSRMNDATITARVKGGFMNAKGLNSLHVKVVTEAGVVYLLGLVTEAEAEKASEIARTTGGVRKVVKIFEYCDPADERCRPTPPPPEKPKPPRA